MPGSRDFICTEKCDKMNLGNVLCLGPGLPAKRSSFGPHRSPLHTDKEGEGRIFILRLRNREDVFSSLLDKSVLREMFLETCLHILHIEERWKKVIWWKPSMEETVLTTLTLHEFDFLTFSSDPSSVIHLTNRDFDTNTLFLAKPIPYFLFSHSVQLMFKLESIYLVAQCQPFLVISFSIYIV